MGRIRVLPYKQGSKSAKALAQALNGKVLKLEGSSFVPKSADIVICWGKVRHHSALTKSFLNLYDANVINAPEEVSRATNKLDFFNLMEDGGYLPLIPEYWTDKEAIPSEVYPVLCRTILSGHSGAGICWADTPEQLVDAPLFTRYVKKSEEFRVHVSTKGVFLVQRKARRSDHENPDWRIRNHQNGFIYQRENIETPDCVITAAKAAFEVSCLDFGAVDVIYNKHYDRAYVLEINTAPGLAGSTVTDYANMIKELIQ